jgi:hypothetical protein
MMILTQLRKAHILHSNNLEKVAIRFQIKMKISVAMDHRATGRRV